MAVYLYNGICTKIIVSKQDGILAEISPYLSEQFNLSLYQFLESENNYTWKINTKLLEENIKSFLIEFYTEYSSNNRTIIETKEILEILNERKLYNNILNFAKEDRYQNFHFSEFLNIEASLHDFKYSIETIIISMDGKILMEVYDEFLPYLEKISRHRYKNNILSDALKIIIE